MPLYKDDLGRNIQLPTNPQRIVSLVPSLTELLYDLGLDAVVTGITKFCIHPAQWHQSKTRIGGTKNLNIDKIKELQPDLIIANKEENEKEQIDTLAQLFPVWVSNINTLEDALLMIKNIGLITNTNEKADAITATIQQTFLKVLPEEPRKAVYLIWKDPYMSVGGDTFISNMLQYAGFQNVLGRRQRYPEITLEELQNFAFDYLLLSSEPYPFSQKHIKEFEDMLPGKKIVLVDGEMFSWYGSRLLQAPGYFVQLQQSVDQLIG